MTSSERNHAQRNGGRDLHVDVRTQHGDYPAGVREQVGERLVELTRFFQGTHSIRAILDHSQDRHKVELLATTGGRTTLAVDASSETFSKALNESIQRMQRALSKHKQMLTTERRRPTS